MYKIISIALAKNDSDHVTWMVIYIYCIFIKWFPLGSKTLGTEGKFGLNFFLYYIQRREFKEGKLKKIDAFVGTELN